MFLGCGLHLPAVSSGGVLLIDPATPPTSDGVGIDLDTGVLWKADTGEYYSIPDGIARTDLLQWLDYSSSLSEDAQYRYILDKSGNGNFAKYNKNPYVITADGSQDRLVGFFEAPTQVTVPIPQEITSEWQCFFDTSIIQDDPLYFERLYELPTSGVAFRVYVDTDAYPSSIIANGNGVSGLVLAPDVIFKGILQRVQVYMRLGGIKVIVDGIDYGEKAATWLQTSWSSFVVGGSSISVGYTGVMLGFTACNSDGEESWVFPSLVGSRGTVSTITGGTNFSTKGIQYRTNLNPSADAALILAGILDAEVSQSEINALHDGSTIFTSESEIKTLIYSAAQTGTDQAAALTYVGK